MSIPVDEARALIASDMSEADFLGWVATSARMLGYLCYHTHDSRRSEAGFPDLCLVRGARIIFAELKTMRGKVTVAQQRWIDALNAAGTVEVCVWKPDQLDEILEVLRAVYQSGETQ